MQRVSYFLLRRIVCGMHVIYCILHLDNTGRADTGDGVYRHGQVLMVYGECSWGQDATKKYVFVSEVHQRNTCLVHVTS